MDLHHKDMFLSEEELVEEERRMSSHQRSLFHGLIKSARKQLPKPIVGSLLVEPGLPFMVLSARGLINYFYNDVVTTSIDEVSSNAKPPVRRDLKLPKRVKKLMEMIPHQEVNEEEASLFDMLWLLLASVVFVPIFQKIPGGICRDDEQMELPPVFDSTQPTKELTTHYLSHKVLVMVYVLEPSEMSI
ncbi:hypothetical protein LOK49_LG03G02636 [Camellia lanceoleosa]|uniref:Uncharacterized protein n=1 Tax=Camellia lanceoleosa TaxID=1840588 RepID=A0ACC0I9Q8_9ERIC|nr:hypothetical protein LOK49_LG03G02636 [Camellia lanceoleosa]